MKLVSTLAAGVFAVVATLGTAGSAKAHACVQTPQVVYNCPPYNVQPAPVFRRHVYRPRVVSPRPVVRPVVRHVVRYAPRPVHRAPAVVQMCCINDQWVTCPPGYVGGGGGYARSGYVSTAGLGRWAE